MNFKERKNLLEGKQQVHLLRFLDQLNDDEKQILFSQIDAVDWGFEQAFHNDKKKEDTMIEEIDALHLDKIQADSERYRSIGLQAIKELVKIDSSWVPSDPGTSLYIRPFLYSTDPTLALHGVHEATFAIILSPSGSYFSDGLKPVPIMVETEDVRAVRGGTGEAKCGGNYAAANRAGDKAIEKGYSQVLWLDGVERKYVEEGGGMNVMFKIAGKVVTPMLTGSILRGVTRKSCIELLKSWGVPVEERLLSVDELFEAAKNGTLEEAWCVGTAAVISPIGELAWNDDKYVVNNNQIGELSQKLYDELTGIQWGTKPDPFNWTCIV